jgi:hypothetical protein
MFGFTFLSDPTLRLSRCGVTCTSCVLPYHPPFGHPSKGGEWAAQGIIHHLSFLILHSSLSYHFPCQKHKPLVFNHLNIQQRGRCKDFLQRCKDSLQTRSFFSKGIIETFIMAKILFLGQFALVEKVTLVGKV